MTDDDRKPIRVKTFRVTSNLGNVRTVTIYAAAIQNGIPGIKAEIDRLDPGEEVQISRAMMDDVSL